MKKNIIEIKEVAICPKCSEENGDWEVVSYCSQCLETFDTGSEVFCGELIGSAGEHFCCKECKEKFEQKVKNK